MIKAKLWAETMEVLRAEAPNADLTIAFEAPSLNLQQTPEPRI